MNLEQRTRALLALVDAYRRQRHHELVDPARAQARAILKAARAQARRRVHNAVAEARERVSAEAAAAAAALQTGRRLAAQRQALAELALAWSVLKPALLARWRSPMQRALWLAAAVRSARALLPAGVWRIEHAPDWPASERDAVLEPLRAAGVEVADCRPDPAIAAGLRVRAGRNQLDATLDGLLADRAALEARLLQALEPAPSQQQAGGVR